MRNILFFAVLFCFPAWVAGQPTDFTNREQLMEKVYSVKEFRRTADSLQLSVSELSHYPIIFPVKRPYISSYFGKRLHPVYKVRKKHTGIDFAKITDTSVYATGNGVVIRKGYDSGYGFFIEIEHAGGFRTFYAHLSKTFVKQGDTVGIGKHIACMGDSGLSTGCHLHYEIRKGGRFLNPIEWCCCLLGIVKNH